MTNQNAILSLMIKAENAKSRKEAQEILEEVRKIASLEASFNLEWK